VICSTVCLIYLITIFISGIWVYYDSKKLNINYFEMKIGSKPWSPISWLALTILVWPIMFPYYLYKKFESESIRREKALPKDTLEFILLFILGVTFIIVIINNTLILSENIEISSLQNIGLNFFLFIPFLYFLFYYKLITLFFRFDKRYPSKFKRILHGIMICLVVSSIIFGITLVLIQVFQGGISSFPSVFVIPMIYISPFFLIIAGFGEIIFLYHFFKNRKFIKKHIQKKNIKRIFYLWAIPILGICLISWRLQSIFSESGILQNLHIIALYFSPILIFYTFITFSKDTTIKRTFEGKNIIHIYLILAIITIPTLCFFELWFSNIDIIYKGSYYKSGFFFSGISLYDGDKIIQLHQFLSTLLECLGIAIGIIFISRLKKFSIPRIIKTIKYVLIVGLIMMLPLYCLEFGLYTSNNSISSVQKSTEVIQNNSTDYIRINMEIRNNEEMNLVIFTDSWVFLEETNRLNDGSSLRIKSINSSVYNIKKEFKGLKIDKYFFESRSESYKNYYVNIFKVSVETEDLGYNNITIPYHFDSEPINKSDSFNSCFIIIMKNEKVIDFFGEDFTNP
jgi:hypothetical protein